MNTRLATIKPDKGQYKITIPRDFIKELGWDHVEHLMITMHEQGVLIIEKPQPLIPVQINFPTKKVADEKRTWKKEIPKKKYSRNNQAEPD